MPRVNNKKKKTQVSSFTMVDPLVCDCGGLKCIFKLPRHDFEKHVENFKDFKRGDNCCDTCRVTNQCKRYHRPDIRGFIYKSSKCALVNTLLQLDNFTDVMDDRFRMVSYALQMTEGTLKTLDAEKRKHTCTTTKLQRTHDEMTRLQTEFSDYRRESKRKIKSLNRLNDSLTILLCDNKVNREDDDDCDEEEDGDEVSVNEAGKEDTVECKINTIIDYTRVKNYLVSRDKSVSNILHEMKLSRGEVTQYRESFIQLRLKRNRICHPSLYNQPIETHQGFLDILRQQV